MASRCLCLRYLVASLWASLLEFKNFLIFGSIVAFLSPLLKPREGCFPGPPPWCLLGWLGQSGHACAALAPARARAQAQVGSGAGAGVVGGGGASGCSSCSGSSCSCRRFTPAVICMVGASGGGKRATALKLARFMAWIGHPAKVFGPGQNMEAMEEEAMEEVMEEAVQWIRGGGEVAILDGENATRSRRQWVHGRLSSMVECKVMFVECVSSEEGERGEAMKGDAEDTPRRGRKGPECYEEMRGSLEPSLSFVRLLGDGEGAVAHLLDGHLHSTALAFLTAVRLRPRTLYFSRHGESEYNVVGRIGGDTDLSPRGVMYARALARHMNEARVPDLRVWTSTLKRTKQTTKGVRAKSREAVKFLDELNAGVCEGLTYEEMAERFPQEFAWRDQDKLRYRYPWGESYLDIMERIRPVLLELEGQTNVLTVSHQAVLRCILGYFTDKSPAEVPYIDVPLHTIIKLTSEGHQHRLEFTKIPIECVDTYRRQPKNLSPTRSMEEVMLSVPAHYGPQFDTGKLWQMMGPAPALLQ